MWLFIHHVTCIYDKKYFHCSFAKHLTYLLLFLLTPLHPLYDIRLMSSLPRMWSLAACCGSPHDMLILWSSRTTVLRQVFLGLQGTLLPTGIHLKVTLGIRSCSILNACPSHRKCLDVMSLVIVWLQVFLYCCSFDIFLDQKILHLRLRHLLWKTSSLLISVLTTRQHSKPYRRIDLTLLFYRRIFVLRLYCLDLV